MDSNNSGRIINQRNSRKWDGRGMYVGLSYNLGNKKFSLLEGKEEAEEQEQIKSRGQLIN